MKKLLSLILALSALFTLVACSKTEEKVIVPEPTVVAVVTTEPQNNIGEKTMSANEQLKLISANKDMWNHTSEFDPFFYSVTDLDNNGRLELFAAITQGTGIFTTGYIYEVNEDFTGLTEIPTVNFDADFMPEVIVYTPVTVYIDTEIGTRYYIFNDLSKNGAAEYYESINALSLEKGIFNNEILAYGNTIYDGYAENKHFYLEGEFEIDEARYNGIAEEHFARFDKTTVNFNWFSLDEGSLDELLLKSYEIFTGTRQPEFEKTPIEVTPVEPTLEPSRTIPIGVNGDITITKNPSGEALNIGGKTWFIAHANNGILTDWQLIDPYGNVYSVNDAMAANPGLSLQVLEGDTIAVSNVPESLNGWGIQAIFSNATYKAATEPAYIYVGDYLTAYASVLNKYSDYYNGRISAEAFMDMGGGDVARGSQGAGYAFKDMNKDGVPELLIAAIGSSDKIIFEIDTLLNGNVVNLCVSNARNRFYLLTDNRVFNQGSNGAAYSVNVVNELKNGNLNPQIIINSDLDANNNIYWKYIDYTTGGYEQIMSESGAIASIRYFEDKAYVPPLTGIK